MTTTTCDICGNTIPNHIHNIAKEITGKATLVSRNHHPASAATVREFSYKLEVERFHFNCTNFALCKTCLIDAIHRSVTDIVDAEKVVEKVNPE